MIKKWTAVFAAALLLAAPAKLGATADGEKAPLPLVVVAIENPGNNNGGLLNATYQDGVLLLDYDKALAGEATLVFTLATADGKELPGEGKVMFLRGLNEDELLDPKQEGMAMEGRSALAIQTDVRVKSFRIRVESELGEMLSPRISVLWRNVTAGPPIRVASVWPGKAVTIGVGQELEMRVELEGEYSDKRVSLEVVGYNKILGVNGLTLLGVVEGKETVLIKNGMGETVETVEVTVQAQPNEYAFPATESSSPRYRVLAPSLDAFAAPGADQKRLGILLQNQIVSVEQIQGDWVQLSTGVWVLERYLAEVTN